MTSTLMSSVFGPAVKTLAHERASVVLSQQHGLRLGGHNLQSRENLPSAVARWLNGLSGREVLLAAHHFSADDWQEVWHDADFPSEYLARGGLLRPDFVKVLFVNSF